MAFKPGRICMLLSALAVPALAMPPMDDHDRVVQRGNVHPAVAQAEQVGRPVTSAPMERMILSLRIAPEAKARLETLLAQQQDPASPLHHQWLTPEAFGERFGPSRDDLDAVVGWLRDNDFTVEEITAGRTAVVFSGDVQSVERAFRTLILNYKLEGQAFRANAIEPSLPRALASVVHGVVSLHNVPRQAMNHGFRPAASDPAQPLYSTGSGAHYLSPADFATIYNAKPLYKAGIDGTGVTIAVVGRTHFPASDVTSFRSQFGLPAKAPTYLINGSDPGDLGAGEDGEAALDVEWAGAVARNANITFVMSKSTATTDGVDLSAQYIVSRNLAPIMTTSFGQCEASMGSAENNFYNNLWAQAAAQGISSFVASGDSGAAGCSYASAAAGSGAAVNGLASTPYNICVGGTQFNDGTGSYWSASTAADGSSALGYIPEKVWNESGLAGGSALWATGGGISSIYAKPAWQVAPGVPADGRRACPDVALTASSHDGYLILSQGSLQAAGGTSCATPAFAGLMALVVQSTGQRQGNANPIFYKLAYNQYKGSGPAVFHDTITGNNSVPGCTGYSAGTGYDLATGLGSVDAQALVSNWSLGPANKVTAAIATPSASLTIASGASIAFNGTATDSSTTATLSYAWSFGDGASGTGAALSHTFSNTGIANAVVTVTLTVTDSTGVSASATRVITVTPAPRNTLTTTIAAPAGNLAIASGTSVTFAGSGKDSSATATLSYAWKFDDGSTGAGASVSHTFSNTTTASLVRTVTLTVTDNTGVTATATRTVTVAPAPRNTLTATIAAPTANVAVASGASVAFAGSGKDSSATATLSYAWNFGDGTSGTGASLSHVFSNTTTASVVRTVTLTVGDNTGITASATRTVTVAPAPRNTLTATIATPAASVSIAAGATVAFTGTGKDSSTNATLSYAWNFGDGSSGAGASVSHSYGNTTTAAVTYTATLTVTDSTGVIATASRAVTVAPAPARLTVAIASPTATVTVASGATVALTGVATDTNPNPAFSYSWSGSAPVAASTQPVALVTTSTLTSVCNVTITNNSTVAIAITMTFTVADNQGAKGSASRTIIVKPR